MIIVQVKLVIKQLKLSSFKVEFVKILVGSAYSVIVVGVVAVNDKII